MAKSSVRVQLTPPQISSTTLLERLVCTRPMREGRFNISVEQVLDKQVIHCYGMGGAGWTTLFGCIAKAIELFQNERPNPKTPIRVLGAGCFGLTAAIELSRLGYHVAGITAKSRYEIPSWKAAGYFALVSVKTFPEEQEELNQIGLETFLIYQMIDRGEHPYISKKAVKLMPVYCSKETDAGIEALEARGSIPPREEVVLDFGNGVVHENYLKYMTYFMNTTTMMRQLTGEVKRLGIEIALREINALDEVEEEIIFNCTGFGGGALNQDEKMIPVTGHLISLNEQAGSAHMEYMIFTKVKQDGKDEYVYLFPKDVSVTPEHPEGMPCQAILGGSFIPSGEELSALEQEQLHKREFAKLLDRNSQFFLGHPFNR